MEVFNKPIKQEDKATRVHFGLHFQHSLQIYGNLIYDFNQVGRTVTYQVPTKNDTVHFYSKNAQEFKNFEGM